MARDPAGPPTRPVVAASNAALVTGIVLVIVGLFTPAFVLVVGIFLVAVAIGLALVNRSGRGRRSRDGSTRE